MISPEESLEKQLLANEARWKQLQDLYANEMGQQPNCDIRRTNRSLFSDWPEHDDDASDLTLQLEFNEVLKPIRSTYSTCSSISECNDTVVRTGPAAAASLSSLKRDLDERWFSNDQLQPDSDDFVDILNNLRILAGQLPTTIR